MPLVHGYLNDCFISTHLCFLQLSKVYQNSLIGDSFDRVEVEEFIKGSVIVNYYVHFKNFGETVFTSDLKTILNNELEFDSEGSNDGVSTLGRFRVDPNYTDFVGKERYLKLSRPTYMKI